MSYNQKAIDDAENTVLEFQEQILEMVEEGKEISNDLFNDYPNGDSYHHESHVDAFYDLKEAAEILDDLRKHEETDNGLWQGLDPREAIGAQAAYTYGNAVMYYWNNEIEDLNDKLSDLDGTNEFKKVWMHLYIELQYHEVPNDAMFDKVLEESTEDFTGVLIYCDWVDDNCPDKQNFTKKIRDIAYSYVKKCEKCDENPCECEICVGCGEYDYECDCNVDNCSGCNKNPCECDFSMLNTGA